jgi:hypothetical protein
MLWANPVFNVGTATILLGLFAWFVLQIEKKEIQKIVNLKGKSAENNNI